MRRTPYSDDEIREYVESNSSCKFIETYMRKTSNGSKRVLKLVCKCGKEFEVLWVKFNRKDGKKQRQCRRCGIEERAKEQRMTDEEYIILKKKAGITIEHLEPADGKHKPIRHRCPECGNENWKPIPKNILNKASTKCAKCARKSTGGWNKLDNETYQQKKKALGIDIINVEPYKSMDENILHICPDCGGPWFVAPARILTQNSQRCLECSYKKRGNDRILTEKQVHEIAREYGCEWVEGEYEGHHSVLSFRCECGNIFKKRFSDFRNGWTRCSDCAKSISTGEYRILEWLTSHGINFKYQQRFPDLKGKRGMPLSYDFMITDDKENPFLLIEYDGEHHFRPLYDLYKTKKEAEEAFNRRKELDKRKDEYAAKNNIPLLRLSSRQYENLDNILGHLL